MPRHNGGETASKMAQESNVTETTAPESTASSSAFATEKPEAVWARTKVILAFWAVIVFLGLPMWWKTTSIYRANLPISEMNEWAEGKVCQ
jgi:phosphatidylinositol glycan class S